MAAADRWREEDPAFGPPVILREEDRERPAPHRYVHGRLEGSETTFSCYFPPSPRCGERFLQYLGPGAGGVDGLVWSGPRPSLAATGVDFPSPSIAFAASCGAYLLESNQGFDAASGNRGDESIVSWRANAQVARAGALIARRLYGRPPGHGYVFGGSGGGRRAMLALEQTSGVWDGAVPYLIGADGPGTNPVVANAMRLLTRGWSEGEPAPADGLGLEEGAGAPALAALAALAALGSPLEALHALPVAGVDLGLSLSLFPPEEVERFWADREEGSGSSDGGWGVRDAPFRESARVLRVVTATELVGLLETTDDPLVWRKLRTGFVPPDTVVAFEVDSPLLERWRGGTVRVESGAEAGRAATCVATTKNLAVTELASGSFPTATALDGLRRGDLVSIDDRAYLAFCATPADRPASAPGSACRPTGRFSGKMIHVNALHDFLALPGRALEYASLASALDDRLGARYRLWLVDRASHYPPGVLPPGPRPVVDTLLVDYGGVVEQALCDLIAWVEEGREPPPGAERLLPGTKRARARWTGAPSPAVPGPAGIQPAVSLRANGLLEARVDPGSVVKLDAEASIAPHLGRLVAAEWDLEGGAAWRSVPVAEPCGSLRLRTEHAYRAPGRYRATIRVWSHRDGDRYARHRRVANLAHVTVIVRE